MNFVPIALIFVSVWLGVLTLAVLVLIRQTAINSLRLSQGLPTFSLDHEGPEAGTALDADVLQQLPPLSRDACLLLLSASCAPCREVAADLGRWLRAPGVVVLVAGPPDVANAVASMLPEGVDTVYDPAATEVADALSIRSIPFALTLRERVVSDKTYVHDAKDVVELIERAYTRDVVRVLPMEGAR